MISNFDINGQFTAIKNSAMGAMKEVFPVEGKVRKMELVKVWVDDNLNPSDYNSQLKTKERNGTWGVPVYASLRLIDKASRKVIDEEEKVKIFTLPKLTDRFSYIVGGNEYQVSNQLRRKSGVYTLRKQNGELKTTVNLSKGKNFDIEYNEDKSLFTITKVGGGQANVPLYPVLLDLGISAQTIEKEWGAALARVNAVKDDRAVSRARAAFGVPASSSLSSYFKKTEVDPSTTKNTLGEAFSSVDGMMLVKAAKKLLDVHLGKKEPEDPNSLANKEIHGVEDFIQERIEKNKNTLSFKVKRNIDNVKRNKISQIVNPGAFNSVIENFFVADSKSTTTEQTNPLSMLSNQYKVTLLGEGGIQSEHAITEDVRNVHPTHYGFIDPVHTPESGRIGANLHLPLGAVKDGKVLKSIVLTPSGQSKTLSPEEAFEKRIAFPNQKGPTYKVIYRGKVEEVSKDKIDYYTPDHKAIFSYSTNLVPFLQNDQGNRAMMAAKMHEQAISLKHRERPLVQVQSAGDASLESMIGNRLALRSPVDGVIQKVENGKITIKSSTGENVELNAYDNFHLNRKSFLHHDLSHLKKDVEVKKGDLLADSNFTRGGDLALGVNMRTAYLPYKGYNFEDGIIVTESAAKKLTSEHTYKESLTTGSDVILRLNTFKAHYPNTLSAKNMAKLDEDGIIKEGQKVEAGDIIVAALQKRDPSVGSVSVFSKRLSNRPKDISLTWEKGVIGSVQKVIKGRSEVTVIIRTEESAVIGDKLAGRHGNKGVITKIIPDSDAPRNKEGEPVEMLLNPHGIISRINVGQIYESAAAKAADKNGKPYIVENFADKNYLKEVNELLKKNNISDKEELYDPSGKKLGRVHVGKPHILKLFKQTDANFSAREGGAGQPYDLNQQPLKLGGEESPKSMDMLTMYSMLAHGARENLRETASLKSAQNDEYWTALKSGRPLPPPQTPFVYEKFLGYLKGAGVDTKQDGSKMTLAPLTDSQILQMSSGEISKPVFFRAKDMSEIKDGFFDKNKLGGLRGDRWGHVKLNEPIVNPIFEGAVKKLTGLGTKYEDIVSGKLFLHADGTFKKESSEGAITGGAAIKKILSEIDVKSELKNTLKKLEKTTGTTRDSLNKKARYLMALDKLEVKPEEAYIREVMPVVPPQYRPLYSLPDGNITTSDVNFLYQNVGVLNKMFEQPVMDLLPEEEKSPLRDSLNDHMRAVSGLTDMSIKGRERKGFISQIAGPSPKKGFFIDKVLAKQQDYVGRGTIIPEPSLGVDEMGMPEKMAWKLFTPFVIKELRKFGKTPTQAQEEIDKRTKLARKALDVVMASRTVLLNRAPSLHKFSVMAFQPKITEGKSIKIPPLVTKGFNADFDGDTMTVHTPISDKAVEESRKMMPSRNLYKPGTGQLMIAPDQEAQLGLFYISKTPEGRKAINAIVGTKFAINKELNKGETKKLLERISKEAPNEFGQIIYKLKELGEDHAYNIGFSLGVEDLIVADKERDKIVKTVSNLTSNKSNDINQINSEATRLVDKLLDQKLKDKNNPLYDMVESGARGSKSQLRSILATPIMVADAKNQTIPTVIQKSYAEGLSVPEYWTTLYGARKGMIDRAVQTAIPGAYAKDILNSTIDMVVAKPDCGTKNGIDLPIEDSDVLGRFAAQNTGTAIKYNEVIDARAVNAAKKAGMKTIKVRSPLTCELDKGVCQKCSGLDEFGKAPEIGANVGATAGQAIAEPLVQISMNSFHTGGVAGTGINASGIARIDQLLKMPETVVGAAKLAPVDASVVAVKPGVGGGKEIHLKGDDGSTHVIKTPQGREIKVRVGQRVNRGDAISDGPIKPQELVVQKGMLPAQQYIVDELQKEYKSQGPNIHGKIFEHLVRSITDTTVVTNNPRHAGVIPGDIASYNAIQKYNRELAEEVELAQAEGAPLAVAVATLKEGTILTKKELALLASMGYQRVKILKDAIQHEPILKNITTLPILKEDWMAALGYRNLKKVITEGASKGLETDLEGYHPIPAYARGTNFGRGKDGKY